MQARAAPIGPCKQNYQQWPKRYDKVSQVVGSLIIIISRGIYFLEQMHF